MIKTFGLIGERLGHSFSPMIHSQIFKYMNIDGCYSIFEVERQNLSSVENALKTLGIMGANVTIPYKVEIIKYLDGISKEALDIGAVNTIVIKDGISKGYNTDYFGFGNMLYRNEVQVKNKKSIILGSGGASKAVCQYMIDNEAKDITMVSRNIENVKKQYKDLRIISYEEAYKLKNYDLIINCTPVGMYPNMKESPVKSDMFNSLETAIDLIYNPLETLFLKEAREKGLKTINGLYMLIGQALKAEELWNNIIIDKHIGDKIYKDLCKQL